MSKQEHSWAVKRRAFHIWQLTPHKVAPMDQAEHTCQSCGTMYQGNNCPRCGQSSRVGRFSFKTAFLLFLDVWGIGNRGMFRSIRDLILRPGYMIRDYVGGMQSAYFPPFKMFFIVATFSFLLSHGFNLFSDDTKKDPETEAKTENVENTPKADAQTENASNATAPIENAANAIAQIDDTIKELPQIADAANTEKPTDTMSAEERELAKETNHFIVKVGKYIAAFEKKSPALFSLLSLILITMPLYVFFRRCPAIPDLRFSEHVVAMVYTSNMFSLYSIVSNLIPLGILSDVVTLVGVFMFFVALKQFTGYSKWRLLGYVLLAGIVVVFVVFVLISLVTLIFKYT